MEPEDKKDETSMAAAMATPNPYSNGRVIALEDYYCTYVGVPCVTKSNTSEPASLLPVNENLNRVPSQYLKELSRGNFVVKYEDVTLKETIGEGAHYCQPNI